jgi:hypothetical protein
MKNLCNYIFYTLVGACVGALIYANVDPNKTQPQTPPVVIKK